MPFLTADLLRQYFVIFCPLPSSSFGGMGRTVKTMVTQWLPFSFLARKKERRSPNSNIKQSSSSSSNIRSSPTASSSTRKKSSRRSSPADPNSNNLLEYDENVLWLPAKEHLPFIMNSIEDDTDCILCCDVMMDPVTLPCGHSMCQVCLAKAYLSSPTRQSSCPVCRLDWITPPPINYCLRSVIEKLFPRKLAQRRLKNNTWGHADEEVLREFERVFRARAVLRNSNSSSPNSNNNNGGPAGARAAAAAAVAARYLNLRQTLIMSLVILTALLILGLSTSTILAILATSSSSSHNISPSLFDAFEDRSSSSMIFGTTFASMPNFLAVHGMDGDDDDEHASIVTRSSNKSSSARVAVNDVGYHLAEKFIQRSWLPHGRIDQWTTSDVIYFLKNAGLIPTTSTSTSATTTSLHVANEVVGIGDVRFNNNNNNDVAGLRKRLEVLKINGSMLLNLHERQVWDEHGLNITQPGTYHALMMMIYGLRNFLHSYKDPMSVFCSGNAVHCVYVLTSFYAAPHLFWLYSFLFHYHRYFVPLVSTSTSLLTLSSPNQCNRLLSAVLPLYAARPLCGDAAVNATAEFKYNAMRTLLTAVFMPRLPMLTILLEHYNDYAWTLFVWSITIIGVWNLFASLRSQCQRVLGIRTIGLSNTMNKMLWLFVRKSGLVLLVTLTAWLIPVLTYPIMYITTGILLTIILVRVILMVEYVVRYLLTIFGERQLQQQQQPPLLHRQLFANAAQNVTGSSLLMQQRDTSSQQRNAAAVVTNGRSPVRAAPLVALINNSSSSAGGTNVRRRTSAVSVMATHPHNSSSTLIVPSTDADILTQLGVFNRTPPQLLSTMSSSPRHHAPSSSSPRTAACSSSNNSSGGLLHRRRLHRADDAEIVEAVVASHMSTPVRHTGSAAAASTRGVRSSSSGGGDAGGSSVVPLSSNSSHSRVMSRNQFFQQQQQHSSSLSPPSSSVSHRVSAAAAAAAAAAATIDAETHSLLGLTSSSGSSSASGNSGGSTESLDVLRCSIRQARAYFFR